MYLELSEACCTYYTNLEVERPFRTNTWALWTTINEPVYYNNSKGVRRQSPSKGWKRCGQVESQSFCVVSSTSVLLLLSLFPLGLCFQILNMERYGHVLVKAFTERVDGPGLEATVVNYKTLHDEAK